ncbi:aromatic ring-hydroxylating dioxygenase subunit alpha [Rhodospirillaceae bacterium KN72]|uniref:Aromatic ring-hydroxylating dioxygenase subunit alpha n=1 Tax=Pacificispira spongiicola TaxID=2729598 RepID=A0A7Y0DZX3_9PROT|nr:aromatic ring-hydroxylating dioxygenase subunit alpha [Pacificispira spongiicola]NMM44654.1 aromatic ring-hydroxylating dioxygenase subunit alpha [Pacificispira spongiicola]
MEFVKNTWYFAAWSEEVGEGDLFARTFCGKPIVLLRDANGDTVAMLDRCPHRFAPLSMGKYADGIVKCCYHGLEFGLDGKCVRNPHPSGKIPRNAAVPVFATHERHSAIWIWMGDAAQADPALIPDYSKIDEYGVTRFDHFVMDAPYDLIVDNLLDCSHTSFVHDGILGNEPMVAAPTEIAQTGATLNVVRYARDVPPPSMFDMIFRQDGQNVDCWTDFRWDPPCCLLLDVGVCPPGAEKSEGTGYYGIHILTPETDETTHYFTAACRWNINPATENDEMRLKIADLRRFAFEDQDEPLIKAQHRIRQMSDPDDLRPVMLETDAGVVRWRRIIDQMLDRERETTDESTETKNVA